MAAIPPLAGLTGNVQSHPLVFLHGYRIAVLASAVPVACGAVLSFFTIRDDALRTTPAAAKPECTINGAVGAPPLEPGPERAATATRHPARPKRPDLSTGGGSSALRAAARRHRLRWIEMPAAHRAAS